ncbi:hypothetical protein PHAVU_009G156300 [Phaseolus vulgaris]|uniref:NAC domain-containing protein n=1 Tax=Phaseolus vulgaris TaxID=3885 RepID=V7AZY1_PHAVU|nr:hypothetical protein PHAVU_009G156300g [Phaseolus vulgaris]ESW09791.1 hypothetical protein PHAVU_009G156300g [Phaseolus vulgaris]
MEDASFNLPPGFFFSPTDEELVLHFLYCKASLIPCHPNIIPDLDFSRLHPWELNGKALLSGNQYYFFTKVNENRTMENGCWKEIGVTEPIFSTFDEKVGTKKYLVFHIGEEAPHGTETNWVMQEYHICSSGFDTASYRSSRRRRKHDQSWSKWVLCRVYEKMRSEQGVNSYSDDDDESGSELSWLDEVYLSLDDDLEEIVMPN